MTKEQKDKIRKALAEDRNDYVRDCNSRASKEDGKIIGADYMLQRFVNILATEVDSQENDILKTIKDNCHNLARCEDCKYLNIDTLRCKFRDIPRTWEVE